MEKNRDKPKHKTPSRIRYEKKNPVFSVRMAEKWHNDLNALLRDQNLSRRDFMGLTLGKRKVNYKRVHTRGYEKGYYEGYDKGKSDWRIWHFCSVCGETIYIIQNSNSHNALIDYMSKHGWGHAECHKKKPLDTY